MRHGRLNGGIRVGRRENSDRREPVAAAMFVDVPSFCAISPERWGPSPSSAIARMYSFSRGVRRSRRTRRNALSSAKSASAVAPVDIIRRDRRCDRHVPGMRTPLLKEVGVSVRLLRYQRKRVVRDLRPLPPNGSCNGSMIHAPGSSRPFTTPYATCAPAPGQRPKFAVSGGLEAWAVGSRVGKPPILPRPRPCHP